MTWPCPCTVYVFNNHKQWISQATVKFLFLCKCAKCRTVSLPHVAHMKKLLVTERRVSPLRWSPTMTKSARGDGASTTLSAPWSSPWPPSALSYSASAASGMKFKSLILAKHEGWFGFSKSVEISNSFEILTCLKPSKLFANLSSSLTQRTCVIRSLRRRNNSVAAEASDNGDGSARGR